MHGPDGNDYPMKGEFREVTPPGRLCVAELSHGPGDRLANTAMDDVTPDQVFCLDPGGVPRRLTGVGEWRAGNAAGPGFVPAGLFVFTSV
jgi:uncharacterized protein YndB with AHSA1/START domain